MTDRTTLYRHFDAGGSLLYVGISRNYVQRLEQHEAASSWFEDVASVTLEHFPSRDLALKAEAVAIHEEQPAHNARPGACLAAQMSSDEIKEVERIWHCGSFLTKGIITYCKNRFGVEISRNNLVAAFGNSLGLGDMSHEEMMAAAEHMK